MRWTRALSGKRLHASDEPAEEALTTARLGSAFNRNKLLAAFHDAKSAASGVCARPLHDCELKLVTFLVSARSKAGLDMHEPRNLADFVR